MLGIGFFSSVFVVLVSLGWSSVLFRIVERCVIIICCVFLSFCWCVVGFVVFC